MADISTVLPGSTTAAVVLAAGGGTRWDGPGHKLAARVNGVAVLRRAIDAALAAGLNETVMVLGALDLSTVALPGGVTVILNQRWSDGPASSLAVAIDHARAAGHRAVVVGLGDQPAVRPEAWRLVASVTETPIAVATYAGRRGHPVRFAAEMWPALPRVGEGPGRSVQAANPAWTTEVACPGHDADVDTVADLARASIACESAPIP